MPKKFHAKSTRKRRGGRMRKRRGYFKSAVGKGEVMVNRTKARLHNVVAPHYLTRLEYGFTGNFATAGAGTQSYFNVWLNGLTNPGVGDFDAISGPIPNFQAFTDAPPTGLIYPATVALDALTPVGLPQLGNLYDKFRVFASKIEVTYTPSTFAFMSVVPIQGNTLVGGGPGADFQRAQSYPYSKAIMCSVNNNVKQNRISMYMDAPTIVGYTKQQYKDDPLCAGIVEQSNPAGQPLDDPADYYASALWQVNLAPVSSGANYNGMIEVRVTYWVEFFSPLGMTDQEPTA